MNTRAILQELLDKEAENRVHVIGIETTTDWGRTITADIRIQLLTEDVEAFHNAIRGDNKIIVNDPSVEKASPDKDRFEFTKKAVL